MDLVAPTPDEIQEALEALTKLEKEGSVLVFCALGVSRSALIVLAWLLAEKKVENTTDGLSLLKEKRPCIILSPAHLHALNQWQKARKHR